mmetsp:Transcript_94216/g.245798  ORF Transcript_94216/g.245798 Transcript_94216/m.245798 type:complete len:233 (-) Transcript_94216:255-953(-)
MHSDGELVRGQLFHDLSKCLGQARRKVLLPDRRGRRRWPVGQRGMRRERRGQSAPSRECRDDHDDLARRQAARCWNQRGSHQAQRLLDSTIRPRRSLSSRESVRQQRQLNRPQTRTTATAAAAAGDAGLGTTEELAALPRHATGDASEQGRHVVNQVASAAHRQLCSSGICRRVGGAARRRSLGKARGGLGDSGEALGVQLLNQWWGVIANESQHQVLVAVQGPSEGAESEE